MDFFPDTTTMSTERNTNTDRSTGEDLQVLETRGAPTGATCQHHDPETLEQCGARAMYLFVYDFRGSLTEVTICEDHGSPGKTLDPEELDL